MRKIKLNQDFGKIVKAHGYVLDPTVKYVINVDDEMPQLLSILLALQAPGNFMALSDYNEWLERNGFDSGFHEPTNKFVEPYYGKRALWETKKSRGIVVKAENEEPYYIVVEFSRLVSGFKYTQVIVTSEGCR